MLYVSAAMAEPALAAASMAIIKCLNFMDILGLNSFWVVLNQVLLCYHMELNCDLVGDHAGVFPLAFADVAGQALDWQYAVKRVLAAIGFHAQWEGHVGGFALDIELARHRQLAGAGSLDAARYKGGFRELGRVEPFLLRYFLVVFRIADIDAGRFDFYRGLRGVWRGGVVIDGGSEFLELRFHRYIHLLEGGRDGALGSVGFQQGGGRGGDGQAHQGGQCYFMGKFHREFPG